MGRLVTGCCCMLTGIALSTAAICAPNVEVTYVKGIQPGWVRAYATYSLDGSIRPGVRFSPSVTCEDPAKADSITVDIARVDPDRKQVIIDIKSDLSYFENFNLKKHTCLVQSIQVDMKQRRRGGRTVATHTMPIKFKMGLPFSHRHPRQIEDNGDFELEGSIALSPAPRFRRYAAFPPQTIVIRKGARVTFLEVEELRNRKTLGMRRLSTFNQEILEFELGSGGEVFDQWGLMWTGGESSNH